QADHITHPGRVDFVTAAVRIVAVDGSAARIFTRIHVRSGTNCDIHLLAFAIEKDGARPMPRTEALERHYLFAGASGTILGIVFISLDRLRLAHVQVVLPECKTEGAVEPADEFLPLLAFEHVHRSGSIFGGVADEQFLPRSDRHEARHFKSFGEHFHVETRGYTQLR